MGYGLIDYEEEFSALVDADGGGCIEWTEFKKWITSDCHFSPGHKNAETRFEILVALSEKFQSYDTDNSGHIEYKEFAAVKKDWSYPMSQQAFFALVDKDGNG